MTNKFTVLLLLVVSIPAFASRTRYIAANGSDSNDGLTKATAWQFAPGMPSCSATCAAFGNYAAGDQFVFRGGDTWNFGSTSQTAPYTGGTWSIYDKLPYNNTNDINCQYQGAQTGCATFTVDKMWFAGASWARPILNANNSTSTTVVASCANQTTPPAAHTGFTNTMVILPADVIFDNFELTGLCTNNTNPSANVTDTYISSNWSTGVNGKGMVFETNLYIHGWTYTSAAGSGNSSIPCTALGGGSSGLQTIDHVVIDGSDSNPGACSWATFPAFYHFKDSYIGHTTQGIGEWCHDIHDIIFEYIAVPIWPTHGNVMECNGEANGAAVNQPQNTPNVMYNLIFRHTPSGLAGNPITYWCPSTVKDYWFNSIYYDLGTNNGQFFDIGGPTHDPGCLNTGTQVAFNNTFVDASGLLPCSGAGGNTGGVYLTWLNNHLINSSFADTTGCTRTSNTTMTTVTGNSQGYTSASAARTNATSTTSCADETTPCKPTSGTNSTVGAGTSIATLVTELQSYTQEPAISTDAANAAAKGTSDACAYDSVNHVVNCPAQAAVSRNTSTPNTGAYEWTNPFGTLMSPNTFSAIGTAVH